MERWVKRTTKRLALDGPWASLIFVFVLWGALLYVLVLAAILLLYLVAYSTSSHLSLFSYATKNNCPKLAQGCNQPLPRVSYALDNQLQITSACIFLKANLEFSYLCPQMLQMSPSKTYIKYASWFIISPRLLVFLTRFFFLVFFFLLPPPLNRSKALKAAYGISCF